MKSESRDTAIEEGNRLQNEIKALVPYEWNGRVEDRDVAITVNFVVFFSMIDGGFLSYLTGNITHQRCPFCHKLPREFILIGDGSHQIHEVALACCALSILHYGLRIGDSLLKVGFSQDFCQPRVSAEFQPLFDARKAVIQQVCLNEKNGLRVSFPCANGGTSNTGYTMRRVFSKPSTSYLKH